MRYKVIEFCYGIFDHTYSVDHIYHDKSKLHGGTVNFVGALAGILKKPPGRFIYGRDDIIISPKYSYNLQNLYFVQLGNTPFYNYVTRKDAPMSKRQEFGDRSHKQDRHYTMTRFFLKVVDETDPLFNIDLIYNSIDDHVITSTEFYNLDTQVQLRDLIITHEQYNSLITNADSDDFGGIMAIARPKERPDHFGRV